jgi:lipopolysaccharide assembly outer membrane protein LptD (OstA)
MTYNIATKRGKVELGTTEFENAYYKGKSLREVSDNVIFVTSGEYTTCENKFPHYHFYCHKMKMINNDKIIAKPIVMFIGPMPVMALPYYVFPIRKGRHSGFLTFDFGSYKKGRGSFITLATTGPPPIIGTPRVRLTSKKTAK